MNPPSADAAVSRLEDQIKWMTAKVLTMSAAGPYSTATNPVVLLAKRIEGLVSQEHAKWTSGQEQSGRSEVKPASEGDHG